MNSRRLVRDGLWLLFSLALGATLVDGIVAWRQRPADLPLLGVVPPFELTERSGRPVGRGDLAGRPFVVDFVFTRCVLACPVMTSQMAKVGSGLLEGPEFRRVSISVDPQHDTPAVLTEFARKYQAPESWWFLTGDRETIYPLSRDGFRLGIEPATGDPTNPIGHSNRFVLVDGEGRIRGYYDGMSPDEVRQLDRDLLRLVRAGGR